MAASVRERLERRGAEGVDRQAAAGGGEGSVSAVVDGFETSFSGMRSALAAALKEGGVDDALVQYRSMQRLLHEAAPLLPAWDRQRANELLAQALRDVETRRAADSAVRQKCFTFTRRRARRAAAGASAAKPAAAAPPTPADDEAPDTSAQARISGRKGERIFVPPSPSMFLSDLEDCEVFVEPVDGSVFVDRCTGCTFVAAARQLRVHRTTASNFYLHCASQPIIEDCEECGFAPFLWEWPEREATFAATTLASSKNHWDQVNDFKWIRAQQSPHWHVVPEARRARFAGKEGTRL
eukprot:TRINITY_DN28343_c0_g1_i1.p1 TRINITY_DN28343_c0_g1~~TRINITY_DN28343_c0_g1_i1.p1  ORF type:complete len:314 (+),score=107.67 TRINITY_DN28343_c0_g1_i1:56-943(+)